MGIEQDIISLKEAFHEYIKLKMEEEVEKEMNTDNYSRRWDAEEKVDEKYKRVFDALHRGGY
jgi:hypothetical protein